MICINPMAPLSDRACGLALLSACITARIQCSGKAKRLDASVTKAAKGRMDKAFGRRAADDSCSACAAPLGSIDAAKIITMHSILPTDSRAAIVLAAAKDEALARCPGPPLRAAALHIPAGTEERSVF